MFVWEHLAKQPLPYIISYLINIVLNMSLVGIFGSSNRSSLHFFIGTGKHTKNLAFKNTWYPIISKTNWKLLDSIVSVGFTAVLIVNQSIDHLFQLGTLHLFGEVLVVHLKHCGHKGCDILHAKRWSHVTDTFLQKQLRGNLLPGDLNTKSFMANLLHICSAIEISPSFVLCTFFRWCTGELYCVF